MNIKQHVLVAEQLLDDYHANVRRILRAESSGTDEVATLRGQLERVYASVWEQLDAAALATDAAGRSTASYREVRAHPGLATIGAVDGFSERITDFKTTTTHVKYTVETTLHDNRLGLELARKASAALKAAWPDVDWTPAAPQPEVDLRPRGIGGLIARLLGR